jgi:hypothetical protein
MDIIKIFDGTALAASGVAKSEIIDFARYINHKHCSIAVTKFEGAGVVNFTYESSGDGHTFIVPSEASTLLETFKDSHSRSIGSHGVSAGDAIAFASVAGMTEINAVTGTVASVTDTTITTDINSAAFTPYVSGGVLTPGGDSERSCVISAITAANPAVVTVYRGRDIFKGKIVPSKLIKIVATENGTDTITNLTAYLILQ